MTDAGTDPLVVSGDAASLEVRGIYKSWGKTEVLNDVNFGIEPGGFLTLLGPSGCGKSTLLRLISGLDEVSAGEILIDGTDVSGKSASDRNLGMVFQNYALFPHMTIADNIGYGLKVRRMPTNQARKKIDRVAELMGLGKLLDRKPAQLSGGQQQRVAVARVLVSDRPLILMDEPLSNLDAKLRTEVRSEIRSLNKTLGITVVYVTHDQSEALSMSDKVVLLHDGKVAQIGSPKELYQKPANLFSAGFIGTPPTNLIEPGDVRVPDGFTVGGGSDLDRFLIGVRPEAMRFPADGADFSVEAQVDSIEYEGSVSLLHLVTPSGKAVIVAHSGADAPEMGDAISVGWDRRDTHIFTKADGKAVDLAA